MNTLSATYDEEDNRVVLAVTSEPNIQSVSLWRRQADGSLRPIPSLVYCHVECGHSILYDYAAPLNTKNTYRCVFYRGPQLFPDSTCEASVTTTTTWAWLKKPMGWLE